MKRARARGHITTLDKLTERVKGRHRFVEDRPLIVRETHTESGTRSKSTSIVFCARTSIR